MNLNIKYFLIKKAAEQTADRLKTPRKERNTQYFINLGKSLC